MTAQDRQQAIVAAVLALLAADADLGALVGMRLYDAPPAKPDMPAMTIRLVSALDVSSADTEGQLLSFDLDVWDRYRLGADLGRPRAVMNHIRRILHMQNLSVPGVVVLTMRCTGTRGPVREADGISLHGIVNLAVLAGHEAVLS